MGGLIYIRAQTFCEKLASFFLISTSQVYSVIENAMSNLFYNVSLYDNLPVYFGSSYSGNFTVYGFPNLYLNISARNQTILTHTNFFNDLFSCNSYNNYTGNLAAVHAQNGMSQTIGQVEWDAFLDQLLNAFQSAGVTDPTLLTDITNLLNSVKREICQGANCHTALCDIYAFSSNMTSAAWLNSIWDSALTAMGNTPILQPYFDGSQGTNYLSGAARTMLLDKFVGWMGNAINCTSSGPWTTFSATNAQIVQAHSSIPIGMLEYEYFIQLVMESFNSNGVSVEDQAVLLNVLNNTQLFGICNQPNCMFDGYIPLPYAVTIGPKTIIDPWYSLPGSPFAFSIDGNEAEQLTLTVGVEYRFQNEANCSFPFYISTSPIGGLDSNGNPLGLVTQGVTFPAGGIFAVCNYANLFFTPSLSQAQGYDLYYQSTSETRVGYIIRICNSTQTTCSSPPPVTTQMATTGSPNNVSSASVISFDKLMFIFISLVFFFF